MLPSLKIGGSFPTVRLSSPCDICRLRTNGYGGQTNFLDFEIRVHGEKVFEVKWDKARGFKVVHFDQGD
jgi:hypothetical protein